VADRVTSKVRTKLSFEVGDFVWKKNYALSDATKFFAAKFAPRFIKCVVVEKKSDLVYILEAIGGRQLGVWHIKDLKPGQIRKRKFSCQLENVPFC
jgi:hypothetical protein